MGFFSEICEEFFAEGRENRKISKMSFGKVLVYRKNREIWDFGECVYGWVGWRERRKWEGIYH